MGSTAHFIFITGLLLLWPQGPDAGSLLPQIEIWLHGLRLGWAGGHGWRLLGGQHWHSSSLISSVSSPLSFPRDFAFSECQQLVSQNPHKPFGSKGGDQVAIIEYHLPSSISCYPGSTPLPTPLWHSGLGITLADWWTMSPTASVLQCSVANIALWLAVSYTEPGFVLCVALLAGFLQLVMSKLISYVAFYARWTVLPLA